MVDWQFSEMQSQIEKIIHEKMAVQYIAFPARVAKQYGVFVDVIPLFQTWRGEDYSIIEKCPVLNQSGGQSYMYKKNDIVVCLTNKTSIAQLFGDKVREDNIGTTHYMNDAFVIGGFSDGEREEGHVIKYGNNSIQITDEKIVIKGNVEIENDLTISEGNALLKKGDIGFGDNIESAVSQSKTFKKHFHPVSGSSTGPPQGFMP